MDYAQCQPVGNENQGEGVLSVFRLVAQMWVSIADNRIEEVGAICLDRYPRGMQGGEGQC